MRETAPRFSVSQSASVAAVDSMAPHALRHDAFNALAELTRRMLGCQAAVVRIHGDLDLCAASQTQDDDSGTWDPRSLADPLMTDDLGLGFYIGFPLRTKAGDSRGVLVGADRRPRTLTGEDMANLRLIAAVTVDMLELSSQTPVLR